MVLVGQSREITQSQSDVVGSRSQDRVGVRRGGMARQVDRITEDKPSVGDLSWHDEGPGSKRQPGNLHVNPMDLPCPTVHPLRCHDDDATLRQVFSCLAMGLLAPGPTSGHPVDLAFRS